MELSKNFNLKEFIKSDTALRKGIDNTPTDKQIGNIKRLVTTIIQPSRDCLKMAIFISSGFRSYRLNETLKGSFTSDHVTGSAGDLKSENNALLFNHIKDNYDFDQLIWEYGDNEHPDWVHVSTRGKEKNRNQILIAYKEEGETKYRNYVVD